MRTIAYAEFLSPALMTAALVAEARGDRAAVRELVDELVAETEEHPNYRVQYLSEIVRHAPGGRRHRSSRRAR